MATSPTDRLAEHYRPQRSIDEDLQGVEESSVRLDEVLVDPGDRCSTAMTSATTGRIPSGSRLSNHALTGSPRPICLAGARACPPEDCGGVWGYDDLLTALNAPGDSGDPELLEWVGPDFDPEHFDVDDINSSLGHLDTINQVFDTLASLGRPEQRARGVDEPAG